VKPLATVLYEDKMSANFKGAVPLHDLVMRLVEDHINGQTWLLQKQVEANPRNGVDNVLGTLKRTKLLAGAGTLYVLVDRDVLPAHLGLLHTATDLELVEALRGRSNAPEQLHPFFLVPNLEGLLGAIQTCDRGLLPEEMKAALQKSPNDRDLVLREAKKAERRALRDCLRQRQPGLDGLATALAAQLVAQQAP
jgi:hypothetical protein